MSGALAPRIDCSRPGAPIKPRAFCEQLSSYCSSSPILLRECPFSSIQKSKTLRARPAGHPGATANCSHRGITQSRKFHKLGSLRAFPFLMRPRWHNGHTSLGCKPPEFSRVLELRAGRTAPLSVVRELPISTLLGCRCLRLARGVKEPPRRSLLVEIRRRIL